MNQYLIKYGEIFRGKVFVKNCFKSSSSIIPVFFNFDHSKCTGQTKVGYDNLGVFFKEFFLPEFDFGFIVENSEIINGTEYIKRAKLLEISIK